MGCWLCGLDYGEDNVGCWVMPVERHLLISTFDDREPTFT